MLTGFITEQPPVWYNDNSIIGYKLLTIPVEDFLYNFILLYSNVILFEYYKSESKITKPKLVEYFSKKLNDDGNDDLLLILLSKRLIIFLII